MSPAVVGPMEMIDAPLFLAPSSAFHTEIPALTSQKVQTTVPFPKAMAPNSPVVDETDGARFITGAGLPVDGGMGM